MQERKLRVDTFAYWNFFLPPLLTFNFSQGRDGSLLIIPA